MGGFVLQALKAALISTSVWAWGRAPFCSASAPDQAAIFSSTAASEVKRLS